MIECDSTQIDIQIRGVAELLRLEKFTFGVGDRFAHQAVPQLQAFIELEKQGVLVVPVWNKSNREHSFIGSEPPSVRAAALQAVQQCQWKHPWHVDADHIRLETVDRFLDSSDFFTIDVADSIGVTVSDSEMDAFLAKHPELQSNLSIQGIDHPLQLDPSSLRGIIAKYLRATCEAGAVYRHIHAQRGSDIAIEVSMDETDVPQSPRDLLVILIALADQGIPVQTIAPKFTGRFNKGVDYVGDLQQFEQEFREDIAVLQYAATAYGLPQNIKLSVHSGSDKFSIYPIIRKCLKETGAGLHIKTAGTTWLEEAIGLCESGGEGLELVREFYEYATEHLEELCAPYASVIDIDRKGLPGVADIKSWSGSRMAATIRHVPTCPDFNANVRQLLHVAFKVAAKAGRRYLDLLQRNREIVGDQVRINLLQRHMLPLFVGGS